MSFETQSSFISRSEIMNVVNVTANATYAISQEQAGTTFLLNKANGIAFTLPAPTPGLKYKFIVGTSASGGNYSIVTDTTASQFIYGTVVLGLEATNPGNTAGPKLYSGNGSTHVKMEMNGTTKGGLKGTTIVVEAISSTLWAVTGILLGSGTIETPFATA